MIVYKKAILMIKPWLTHQLGRLNSTLEVPRASLFFKYLKLKFRSERIFLK
jgi:hypothetical protein